MQPTLPTLELSENEFLLFKLATMWYFVVVALAGGGVLQRSVVAGHS